MQPQDVNNIINSMGIVNNYLFSRSEKPGGSEKLSTQIETPVALRKYNEAQSGTAKNIYLKLIQYCRIIYLLQVYIS